MDLITNSIIVTVSEIIGLHNKDWMKPVLMPDGIGVMHWLRGVLIMYKCRQ